MAGLLHDVGKLVLLEHCPQTYPAILEQSMVSGQPLWEIESEVLGASHAQVGACLLGLWGLPSAIVDAIAWHHQPGQYSGAALAVLTAVHVANALIHGDTARLDTAFLERVNLAYRVPVWSQLSSTHRTERKLACT
jgi:HD-like signal output (HDOD) protein